MTTNEFRYQRRKIANIIAIIASFLAMVFGLFWLGWILITLFTHALPAFHFSTFTQMTPPPGGTGGLLNAIVGSLLLTTTATLFIVNQNVL